MNKQEAIAQLPNQIVEIWTDSWGKYIGICLEVITKPRAPWRAKCKILFPVELPYGDRPTLEEGRIIEVGNNCAILSDRPIISYKSGLAQCFESKIAGYRQKFIEGSQLWQQTLERDDRYEVPSFSVRGIRRSNLGWVADGIIGNWIGYKARFIQDLQKQHEVCVAKGLLAQRVESADRFYSVEYPEIQAWVKHVQSTPLEAIAS